MKRTLHLSLLLALGLLLPVSAWADHSIKPGDQVGGMTLTKGGAQTVPIWAGFCNPNFYDPVTYEKIDYAEEVCSTPPFPQVVIGHGWYAKDEALRESNWAAMRWELYLDGHKIDLAAFGTVDQDLKTKNVATRDPNEELTVKLRFYDVVLNNPSPGPHTLRTILHVSEPINDGFISTPAGTFEKIVRFTVGQAPPAVAVGMPSTGIGITWQLSLLVLFTGLALVATGQALLRYKANKL